MSGKESHESKPEIDVEKHYRSSIVELAQSLIDAISTSQATQNIPSGDTGKKFWASVLLARVCGVGTSLQRILPGSASNKSGAVWDSAGALSLCRTMFETYLAMFYLCTDEMHDEDYQLRIRLVFLHDSRERPRIVEKIGGSQKDVGKGFYESEADRLRGEISENKVFAALPEWCQRSA